MFLEKEGSAGWRIFREQLFRIITSAGPDYLAAANAAQNIPPPREYDPLLILNDDAAGVPTEPLYQVRQRALLSLLKSGLQAGGQSLDIIKDCVHFGGYLGAAGDANMGPKQAIMLLDMRWAAPSEDITSIGRWE